MRKEAECSVNVTFWVGELQFDFSWEAVTFTATGSFFGDRGGTYVKSSTPFSSYNVVNSLGKLMAFGAILILSLAIFSIFLCVCALNTPAYSLYSTLFLNDYSDVGGFIVGKFDLVEADMRNLLYNKFFYDYGTGNIFRTYLKSGVRGNTLLILSIFYSNSSFFISTI